MTRDRTVATGFPVTGSTHVCAPSSVGEGQARSFHLPFRHSTDAFDHGFIRVRVRRSGRVTTVSLDRMLHTIGCEILGDAKAVEVWIQDEIDRLEHQRAAEHVRAAGDSKVRRSAGLSRLIQRCILRLIIDALQSKLQAS